MVSHLTQLMYKKTPWDWSEDYQKAFETLKKTFTIVPVLARWNLDSKIIVETDTSDRALAAILLTYSGKEIHPIAFHLRTLNDAKLNYDIHDKKLLVIFEAFKK